MVMSKTMKRKTKKVMVNTSLAVKKQNLKEVLKLFGTACDTESFVRER
jgi:hypothetical protein